MEKNSPQPITNPYDYKKIENDYIAVRLELILKDEQNGGARILDYPIPAKVCQKLKELGWNEVNSLNIQMESNIKLGDVLNVLIQFYESYIGFNVSSVYHFNDNSPIENLVVILELTTILKLDDVLEDLMSNCLEALVSPLNCLYLLNRFYTILNLGNLGESTEQWFTMFCKLLDYSAFNLKYLLKY